MRNHKPFTRVSAFFLAALMLVTSGLPTSVGANTVSTGSTSEAEDTPYYVYTMECENGAVYIDDEEIEEVEVKPGTTVTVTYEAMDGYELSEMAILNEDAEEVETTAKGDAFTFTMPESDVVVMAEFTQGGVSI